MDSRSPWPGMLSEAGITAIATGGVLFYKVSAQVLVSFRRATVCEMAEKQAAVSFAVLVSAASRYVDAGFPLAKLAPSEAQRLQLLTLPENPMPASQSNWWNNLWPGSWGWVGRHRHCR